MWPNVEIFFQTLHIFDTFGSTLDICLLLSITVIAWVLELLQDTIRAVIRSCHFIYCDHTWYVIHVHELSMAMDNGIMDQCWYVLHAYKLLLTMWLCDNGLLFWDNGLLFWDNGSLLMGYCWYLAVAMCYSHAYIHYVEMWIRGYQLYGSCLLSCTIHMSKCLKLQYHYATEKSTTYSCTTTTPKKCHTAKGCHTTKGWNSEFS